VDWAICVQGAAQFFVNGAVAGGIPITRARFFPDAKSAAGFCQTLLEPGDVVLIKGSRGVHLETVVEVLKKKETGDGSQKTEA
jgi:UDP-N-acetylmuramoyl-tripeptide--D-alanyl-D-alanine ligase